MTHEGVAEITENDGPMLNFAVQGRTWDLIVPGEVASKANINMSPGLGRKSAKGLTNPRARDKKKRQAAAKVWEEKVAVLLQERHRRLKLVGPVGIHISYFLSRGKAAHTVRRDLDNLTKSMLDGLELGGAFNEGDQQVVALHLEKHIDKENPRVEVLIWRER